MKVHKAHDGLENFTGFLIEICNIEVSVNCDTFIFV